MGRPTRGLPALRVSAAAAGARHRGRGTRGGRGRRTRPRPAGCPRQQGKRGSRTPEAAGRAGQTALATEGHAAPALGSAPVRHGAHPPREPGGRGRRAPRPRQLVRGGGVRRRIPAPADGSQLRSAGACADLSVAAPGEPLVHDHDLPAHRGCRGGEPDRGRAAAPGAFVEGDRGPCPPRRRGSQGGRRLLPAAVRAGTARGPAGQPPPLELGPARLQAAASSHAVPSGRHPGQRRYRTDPGHQRRAQPPQ